MGRYKYVIFDVAHAPVGVVSNEDLAIKICDEAKGGESYYEILNILDEKPNKMYILVDSRLDKVYGGVQGGHALAQWMIEHPDNTEWNNDALIYLSCRLDKMIEEMTENKYDFTVYKEPDFNDTITAVACFGDNKSLFDCLKTL